MKGNIKKLEWVVEEDEESYLEATIEFSTSCREMVSPEWEDLTLGSVEISQKSLKQKEIEEEMDLEDDSEYRAHRFLEEVINEPFVLGIGKILEKYYGDVLDRRKDDR